VPISERTSTPWGFSSRQILRDEGANVSGGYVLDGQTDIEIGARSLQPGIQWIQAPGGGGPALLENAAQAYLLVSFELGSGLSGKRSNSNI
jgi:hypothetical protein